MKKFSNLTLITIIVVIIWIGLAIFFGFYDLQISMAVADQDSLWGNVGANYGESPGYGLIAIALSVLIGSFVKDIKLQKIPGYASIVIGIILLIVAVIDNDMRNIGNGIFIIGTVALFIILTWNKNWENYRKIALVITLLAAINPLVFVQIVKIIWGRVRYRDLFDVGFEYYTPWFIINGPTGNQSFPSGHAAMGWMFLPLLILVKDKENRDPLKLLTIIFVFGWGTFVMLSRVAVGAHYAADILFSTGFAAIVTIVLYKWLYSKERT